MNELISKPEICITGLGMVTSVGHDVKNACASIRAGLRRPAKLNNFYVESEAGYDDSEDGKVTGHPVLEGDCDDTETRLFSLVTSALDDLYDYSGGDETLTDNTPLFLVLPEGYREKTDKERFRQFISDNPDKYPFTGGDLITFNDGHAGMVIALTRAVRAIQDGVHERAVIAGVDSLIGYDDLLLFNKAKRLKTELNSDGFVPGEAAAAILIEKKSTAENRKAVPGAVIDIISTGYEERHVLSGHSASGNGLAGVIWTMVQEDNNLLPAAVISDLNGEPYRFDEWAMVQARVMGRVAGAKKMIYPVRSIGNIGAASAGAAICIAVRAMVRNADNFLILASSDSGARAAVYLVPYMEET